MPVYPDLGLREDDALPVLLVSGRGEPLPVLNEKSSDKQRMTAPMFRPLRKVLAPTIPLDGVSVPDSFFAGVNEQFSVGTDDGEAFGCLLVEQGERRGLAFSHDFSANRYFRKRLAVGMSETVTESTFHDYGTFGFLLFRLEEYVYFLDFSPDVALVPDARAVVLETRHAGSAWRRARAEAWRRNVSLYPDALDISARGPATTGQNGVVVVRRRRDSTTEAHYFVSIEGMTVK